LASFCGGERLHADPEYTDASPLHVDRSHGSIDAARFNWVENESVKFIMPERFWGGINEYQLTAVDFQHTVHIAHHCWQVEWLVEENGQMQNV
jgi:hypothetical protein